MSNQAKASFFIGILFLILTIINSLTEVNITPSFQRAELLAGISSIFLILVAFLWTDTNRENVNHKFFNSKQGFILDKDISQRAVDELAWGSQLLLTATPAATLLVYWDERILLRRGILGKGDFNPASTCFDVRNKSRLLSLPNTKFFPAREEFDSILEELPSIIIYPLIDRGWLIIGGQTERCFSTADEKWIIGWSNKLTDILIN